MASLAPPLLPACKWILLDARFLAKTALQPNGCRVWKGAQSRGGHRPSSGPYGSFWVPGCSGVRAHVFAAWRAGIIPHLRVPTGMNIDHTCTNTLCVEPSHLELVPAETNLSLRWTRVAGIDLPEVIGPQDDVPF